MSKIKPLPYRKVRKKLKKFGVEERKGKKAGKGSHRTFIKPENEDGTGPFTTVKHHGDGTELGYRTIENLLEIFGIDEDDFLNA